MMREFEPVPLYQELHLPPPPPKAQAEPKKDEPERGVIVIDIIGDDTDN